MKRTKKSSVKTVSCLPIGQRTTPLAVYSGILCRGLVAASVVFGLALFYLDAVVLVEEVIPFTAVLYPSLCFALWITVLCINKYTFLGGSVISAGAVAALYFTDGYFVERFYNAILSVYNATVDRLAYAGFAGISKYRMLDMPMEYLDGGGTAEEKAALGAALFTLILAVLLTPAIIRRVRIVYLSLVSMVVIVPVTVFNIVRDNWGFAVMISAFTAVIAMWCYEREHIKAARGKVLCRSIADAAAVISTESLSVGTEEKKPKKKEKKPKRRGKDTDIEAALRLETPSQRRKRIATEKALKKIEKRESRRLLKEQKKEAKKKEKLSGREFFKNSSLGGALGVSAFAFAFLLISLPSLIVKEGNSGIPYLEEVMENARIYVTAFIRGDEVDLNNVASDFEGGDSPGPRTTKLNYPTYRDIQIAFVEVPYNTPVYLKTWIGTKYDFNKQQWTSATLEEVEDYRETFGEDFTPEMITEDFYEAIYPVYDDFPEMSGYRDNYKYGFITERVNVRRSYKRGVLMYMPSQVLPSAGIRQYNSQSQFLMPYDAYFDGIWTSQFFIDGVGFSTVSNVTTMRYPLIGDVYTNSSRYYDISMSYITLKNLDKKANRLSDSEKDMFISEYERELEKEGIQYNGKSLIYRFFYEMTEDERNELVESYEFEKKYSEYVKDVYTELDPATRGSMDYFADMIVRSAYYQGELDYLYLPGIGHGNVPVRHYHKTVMVLVDYMKRWCKYSLEAPEGIDLSHIGEGDSTKAIEAFLYGSVPGYCVHYASALVLMLRYLGIPARYCEGYLVSDFYTEFHTNTDPITRYKSKVLDSDAHAWVEVYYDGIGWVQYEATQPYLDGMYGSELPDAENNTEIDIIDREPADVPPPVDDDGELEVEETFFEKFVRIAKIVIIVILAVAAIAAVTLVIIVLRLTKRSVKSRKALIARTTDVKRELKEEDTKRLINGIFAVYEALDMLPEKGELSPDYAERLRELIGDASDKNIFEVLASVSKEEFGHGMTRAEIASLGQYYRDLTTAVYNGLSGYDRVRFRYVLRVV